MPAGLLRRGARRGRTSSAGRRRRRPPGRSGHRRTGRRPARAKPDAGAGLRGRAGSRALAGGCSGIPTLHPAAGFAGSSGRYSDLKLSAFELPPMPAAVCGRLIRGVAAATAVQPQCLQRRRAGAVGSCRDFACVAKRSSTGHAGRCLHTVEGLARRPKAVVAVLPVQAESQCRDTRVASLGMFQRFIPIIQCSKNKKRPFH